MPQRKDVTKGFLIRQGHELGDREPHRPTSERLRLQRVQESQQRIAIRLAKRKIRRQNRRGLTVV